MGLPLARGPRAACCLPAFPPLFVNRLGAPPLAQEGESWPRASLAPSELGPRRRGPLQTASPSCPREDGRERLGFPSPGSKEPSYPGWQQDDGASPPLPDWGCRLGQLRGPHPRLLAVWSCLRTLTAGTRSLRAAGCGFGI